MGLVLKPVITDLFYQIFLKEPILSVLAKLEEPFIIKFVKAFDLRLNDIKINPQFPSNNYFQFSKFYGDSFFDVSFGLEEISARLGKPKSVSHVEDLFSRLFQILQDKPVSSQKMTILRHCSTGEEVDSYLQSINPYTPRDFQSIIFGRGAIYNLKIPEHELTIHVVVSKSLHVGVGIYYNIEYVFSPNLYDFESAFKIMKDHHDFIIKELKLIIESED